MSTALPIVCLRVARTSSASSYDKALLRLAASVVIKHNDERLVGRRYLSLDSLASLLEQRRDTEQHGEEVLALTAT